MATQSISGPSGHGPDPRPLFDLATGFMRAKHIFVAAELGVFETLGEGSATLEELAAKLGTPARTTRIVVDAVTALGLLERHSDRYRNNDLAQAYLSGRGPIDMRPFLRFWNRLSYARWSSLEESVRLGKGVAGEFNFTQEEQKVLSEGVEAISAGVAQALVGAYDFSQHRRLLDVGGGTGSFLKVLLQRCPELRCTPYEMPATAAVARQELADHPLRQQVVILEGNFLQDPLPTGHDAVLLARWFTC